MYKRLSPNISTTFLIAFLTFILTRIVLLLAWNESFMIAAKADVWHHFYTGLILFGSSFIPQLPRKISHIMRGIAIGLMIDQATLPICLIFTIPKIEYWSIISWGSSLVLFTGYYLATILRYQSKEVKIS